MSFNFQNIIYTKHNNFHFWILWKSVSNQQQI